MAHICSFLTHPAYLYSHRPLLLGPGGGRPRSFVQFRGEIVALAKGMRDELGMHVGARAAILGTCEVEFMMMLLACACNGWVVVLLNDRWSHREITNALEKTTPFVLFVDRTRDSLNGREIPRIICFDEMMKHLKKVYITNEWVSVGGHCGDVMLKKPENDLAVICFTSGTTSEAKGVMLAHTSLCFQSFYKMLICEYTLSDIYLHTAPLFHVGGLLSALCTFQAATQHLFIGRFHPERATKIIQSYDVTAIIAVPTMITDLASSSFPSIRTVLIGGGALNPVQKIALPKIFPKAKIITAYGMTECSSSLVYNGPYASQKFPNRSLSSGYPIPGTQISIHPQTGEVLTSGPHLMMGYWNDPTATSGAFYGKWFRTGDVGELDQQGALWLKGRIKDMIKSGGENIHSSEIEQILIQHPSIAEVAVVGMPHPRLGEMVVAHIILANNIPWSPSHLHEEFTSFCLCHGLSKFKLPRAYIHRTVPFEKSENGKVSKQRLKSSLGPQLSRL